MGGANVTSQNRNETGPRAELLGESFWKVRRLTISVALLGSCFLTMAVTRPAAACKCIAEIRYSVDVNSPARSHIYCSEEEFTECTKVKTPVELCEAGTGWICPLGPSSGTAFNSETKKLESWIGYGFEAVFLFRSLDDFRDCDFGQGLQYTLVDASGEKTPENEHEGPTGTVKVGTRTFEIEATEGFPPFDHKNTNGTLVFGSDNYTKVSPVTTIALAPGPSGSVILRWADLPSIFMDKEDIKKGAWLHDRVLAFAKPQNSNKASCACVFNFRISSTPGSSQIGQWVADSEEGVNCLFTAVGSL